MIYFDFLHNINFKNPEALYILLLLPLILYICHLNLDSIKRKSLFRDFSQKSLKFLYSRKSNLLLINILRAAFFTLLIIAISGPRWNYHEIESKQTIVNNLILLDVSKSMNAIDFTPDRFEQAKREIASILAMGNNFGLVAFAKTSYNLIPITSDRNYIKDYLHNLQLSNFTSEGSNFNFSLQLIQKINKITPLNKVFIVSDFDFDETIDIAMLDLIIQANIKLYPINVATEKGAPIKDQNGQFLIHNGTTVISKPRLDIINILNKSTLEMSQDIVESSTSLKKQRIWHEEYYLFLLPLIIIFLLLSKRSAFLMLIVLFITNTPYKNAEANPLLNDNQNGQRKYNEELFDEATALFSDDYNKGVAAYRARNYPEAIEYFNKNENLESRFNLANSLLLNQETDKAILAYENILKQFPDHDKTIKNLEIARKISKQKNKQDNKDKKKDKEQNEQDQNNNEEKNANKSNQDEAGKSDQKKQANTTPQIKKQDKNLLSNIDKMNNNNLKNQINKARQSENNYVSNPW
ncbi:MAG: VWA domain-containing protein [Rickettsiales bacterium]|jgi:Ca-activated chloride channel homolog|nr:VWA domain-containing protein [Rickettsiales bacterium]